MPVQQQTSNALKVPQMYTKNGVMYIRELSDSDETFSLGRRRAGILLKCHAPYCVSGMSALPGHAWERCGVCNGTGNVATTVIITTIRGGKEIPIMEFEPSGRFNEILAPRLHSMLAQRMAERVYDLSTNDLGHIYSLSRRQMRDLAFNAGLLKWYENNGGRI